MFKTSARWLGAMIAISVLINLVIESISRKSPADTLEYFLANPFAFLLNVMIVALPFFIVFLVRRRVFVCAVVTAAWLLLGVVNAVLLVFRTTPFTAADIRLVKYALNMVTNYLGWLQILILAAMVAAAAVICVLIWKKAPVYRDILSYRKAAVLIALGTAAVLGTAKFGMETGLLAVHFGNINQAYRQYGFPYCFSNSLLNTGISKPQGYDSGAITLIREEEMAPASLFQLENGTKPNVIMVQLESFFDPLLWKGRESDKDPIPFFRSLKKEYPSGYLNVPSVGAGTANTEFEVITGMNLDFFGPGEYPYKTVLKKTSCESAAFDLKLLGYGAHAIHNNEATFYDRHHVFSQLGFDTFTPIEYMNGVERNPVGWSKDKILTGEILKALNSTKGPDYVYTISVQGHGAYPDFEYYCEQIGEMDAFVQSLAAELERREEPTVLVMYGDHLPGFDWTEEEMANGSLFQTEYVVWNNLGLKATRRDVEAYQLSAYVLNLLGIHEGTMMRFHQGHMANENISAQEEELYLENMQALEYDILYGDQEIYGGESPYKATDLKMGIDKIRVDKSAYNNSNLLIFGENFTPYSKVCLDGKPVDTTFVWPELIIARDISDKKIEDAEIAVRQIGRDKVPLGNEIRVQKRLTG